MMLRLVKYIIYISSANKYIFKDNFDSRVLVVFVIREYLLIR